MHRTFEPLIADWQREWYESAPSRRWWVSLRAWAAFACSAAILEPSHHRHADPTIDVVAGRQTNYAVLSRDRRRRVSIPMLRSIEVRSMDAPLAGDAAVARVAAWEWPSRSRLRW